MKHDVDGQGRLYTCWQASRARGLRAWMVMGLLAACLCMAGQAYAQTDFPEGTIDFIIPFGPDGESDIAARIVKPFLEKRLGTSVTIQYEPGSGGAKAWSRLNAIQGDGHTIMGANLPDIVLQSLEKRAGYDAADIRYISWFQYTPDALLVPARSPFKNLEEFVTYARDNPGEIKIGGTGLASANRLTKARFDSLADIQTTYVPFKGTGLVNSDLLARHLDASWGSAPVRLGLGVLVRCLGVALPERLATLPDCPTFKEQGYDLVSGIHRGVAVPKSTPEDIQQKLSAALADISQEAEFIREMEANGFSVMSVSLDDMASFMDEQEAVFMPIVERLNLK